MGSSWLVIRSVTLCSFRNRKYAYALPFAMITTLPGLFYNPTGFLWSEDIHSSAYTKQRAYPRTDLENFTPWVTFHTEIHDAITTQMANANITPDTEYDIGAMPKKRSTVFNEEDVRCKAEVQLHDLVVEVLEILGIGGRFMRSDSGNNQIVGEPDFFWLRDLTLHPKVVVCVLLLIFVYLTTLTGISSYSSSIRLYGQHLSKTCIAIFKLKTPVSRNNSQLTLYTNSMAT